LGINYEGKIVQLRVSHTGIDVDFISQTMQSQKYKTQVKNFQTYYQHISDAASKYANEENIRPVVIASIDTFHHMSGIVNKLKAYHAFL